MGLGDVVKASLESVGVSQELATEWLGRRCKCKDYQMRLNALSHWACMHAAHRLTDAKAFLQRMMGEE